MSRTLVTAADVSASDVLTAPPAARVTRRSPARFVLLGGVPGAGTTTLIRRMAGDLPHVRTVDPDDLRRKIASVVPNVGALPLLLRRGSHVDGRPGPGPAVVRSSGIDVAGRPRPGHAAAPLVAHRSARAVAWLGAGVGDARRLTGCRAGGPAQTWSGAGSPCLRPALGSLAGAASRPGHRLPERRGATPWREVHVVDRAAAYTLLREFLALPSTATASSHLPKHPGGDGC